jgi:ParB family transcriptional regulator, chromosome partitioning protein
MTKKALGRGLAALLPSLNLATNTSEEYLEIEPHLLEVNPEQPRTNFDEQKLTELTDSIKANGLVQPILVRKLGERYQIIAGERRWRAAQRANLTKIPVVVRNIADEQLLELAVIENIMRQELNPIEEALSYQKLLTTYNLTQEQLAQRLGRERSSITNLLRLLRLPEKIQKLIETERLSMGHARAILPLDDVELQCQVAEQVIKQGLSVRETEKMVEKLKQPLPVGQSTPPIDPNIKAAEVKLQQRFSTQVKIQFNKQGGSIRLDFHNSEELERLYSLLLNTLSV